MSAETTPPQIVLPPGGIAIEWEANGDHRRMIFTPPRGMKITGIRLPEGIGGPIHPIPIAPAPAEEVKPGHYETIGRLADSLPTTPEGETVADRLIAMKRAGVKAVKMNAHQTVAPPPAEPEVCVWVRDGEEAGFHDTYHAVWRAACGAKATRPIGKIPGECVCSRPVRIADPKEGTE